MNIGLIIGDNQPVRRSLKIGLEIEEQLTALGVAAQLIDLADDGLPDIDSYDAIILVSENEGPLFGAAFYHIFLENRHHWHHKLVLPVITSAEEILAESANIQMRIALRSLGAKVIAERMIFVNPERMFDQQMKLTDKSAKLAIDRLLQLILQEGQALPLLLRKIA